MIVIKGSWQGIVSRRFVLLILERWRNINYAKENVMIKSYRQA